MPEKIIRYSFGRAVFMVTSVVLLLTAIQAIVLHLLLWSWKVALTDALVSSVLLSLFSFITIIIFRFYQPGATNRIYRFLFGIFVSGIFTLSLKYALSFIYSTMPEYLMFLEKSLPIRFVFTLFFISFIIIINWFWYYFIEQKEAVVRLNATDQMIKEAELAKLRQQLQPHFLFNSLNSINALVVTKPQEARKMIQQLSEFLRGTLKKDEQQLVPFKEELEHLKLYLEIEKVRFGHRLIIDIQSEENSLTCKIPPLILQPIVENAIKFGLYDTIDSITISIHVLVLNSYLQIEIKNPFDPQTQASGKGVGFGLSSIRRRLYLIFGRQDLLSTEKQESIFITTLKIPQLK